MLNKIKHTNHYLHKSCTPFETMTQIYFRFLITKSQKTNKKMWHKRLAGFCQMCAIYS